MLDGRQLALKVNYVTVNCVIISCMINFIVVMI